MRSLGTDKNVKKSTKTFIQHQSAVTRGHPEDPYLLPCGIGGVEYTRGPGTTKISKYVVEGREREENRGTVWTQLREEELGPGG